MGRDRRGLGRGEVVGEGEGGTLDNLVTKTMVWLGGGGRREEGRDVHACSHYDRARGGERG